MFGRAKQHFCLICRSIVRPIAMDLDEMLIPKPRDPVGLLLKKIPEMRTQLDESDFNRPYVVFGLFAEYLKGNILSEDIIGRSFHLFNELAESGDPELVNLVQVGVFEGLVNATRWRALAGRHLGEKAMSLFENAD
jgi:hypothetical protein